MKIVHMRGRVFSGKGEGANFMSLPWAKKQMEEKLGYCLFKGTLNVRLTPDSERRRTLLESGGMEILPPPGFCLGKLFKARLGGLQCGLVVPKVAGYPKDVIEIIASENLRKKLGLNDGSSVQLEVLVD